MSTYSKFYFRPAKGEQITTCITPDGDEYSAIYGRVIDGKERAIEDALVLLFRVNDGQAPDLVARFSTDSDGDFMFGPLESGALYLIKVYKDKLNIRELEIQLD